MTNMGKKRVAWLLMSGGAGATLLFGAMIWLYGRGLDRGEWLGYAWPLVGVVAAIFGCWWLRALYRVEPPVPPAAWTVSLADFIFATIFACGCGAVVMGLRRYEALTPLAAISGFALYLGSALAASLHGVVKSYWRPVYVVSHACATLGTMGVVSLIVMLCVMPVFLPLPRIPGKLIEILDFRRPDRAWYGILRMMIYALPVGLVALALVNAVAGGKKEAPRK